MRVGVRELPTRMWPASAVSDSDLRAVELLFESLMKLSPDGAGGCRWEPQLAEGRPRMTPRGREFRLPENAYWSNGDLLRAVDVRSTVERLKAGKSPRRPRVWADLLDDVNVADPTRVSLTLRQGWLDPLAPMNFKVLPSGLDPDSPQFAKKPVGSGPFVYAKTDPKDPPTWVSFTANPYYGARAGKSGLQRLHEIRFFTYKDMDTYKDKKLWVNEVEADHFDLILDLTAKEAAALREKASALDIRLPPAAVPNRRIYFLAVNNRKPALANPAFRCALAYAIDRTGLLDEFFRATPGQDLHAPLNGPYPVLGGQSEVGGPRLESWAANPGLVRKHGDKVTTDPFDVEAAKAKLREAGLNNVPTLKLEYPADDRLTSTTSTAKITSNATTLAVTAHSEFPPSDAYTIQMGKEIMSVTAGQGTNSWTVTRGIKGTTATDHEIGENVYLVESDLESAMIDLCAQVKETLGVTLAPTAVTEEKLRKDVEDHNYDLAYYHYDYPDDVYWLGPLLDPAGDNYLGYQGALVALVRDESRRRDFAEVQARAHELHDRFLNQEMPFIPLWQLDPLAAVSNGVAAPPFDPLLVFTDAERWSKVENAGRRQR